MKFLNETIYFLQQNGTILQTICSILMLVVTIIYVRATYRMVHVTHKSFIRIINMTTIKDNETLILIKNFGPSIALNVKLFIRDKDRVMKEIDESAFYPEDGVELIYSILKDPSLQVKSDIYELEPAQEKIFKINEAYFSLAHFLLYWETISGEKQYRHFKVVLDEGSKIKEIHQSNYGIRRYKNHLLWLLTKFFVFMAKGSLYRSSLKEQKEYDKKKRLKKRLKRVKNDRKI